MPDLFLNMLAIQRGQMRSRVVIVNYSMQQGYSYELTARAGRDLDPEFGPICRPKNRFNAAYSVQVFHRFLK